MKINVRKLDQTIAKLTELRRLATDPALSDFIEVTGVKPNSNGATPHVETETNGSGHGQLRANVLAACKTLTGNFTIKNVFEAMTQQGHEFTSDTAAKSVGNVLRTLAAENAIAIAVQGKGRRATEYNNP
jgi:hypothetical protein